MNTTPELDHDAFDIEDSGDIIGLLKSLVDGHHPGLLCTIDARGWPAIRWMTTLAFETMPVFQTLTAPDSRKVAQIRANPAVTWMFFNHDRSLILNLTGRARVLTDTATLKRVWKQVQDKSHTYFLQKYARGPGFVVVETTVETIECNSPENGLRFTLRPEDLATHHHRS